jgi:endonuclease YncB( thermonuclease family)
VSDTVPHRRVKFVQKYPDKRKVATGPLFSWSHYRRLIAVADDKERLRLEKAAARKGWSADELTARVREEKSRVEGQKVSTPAGREPLTPLRGTVYTYRLVERPDLSAGDGFGLLVDFGFGVYHEVDGRPLSGFAEDDIVEIRPKEGAYKLTKSGRAVKDLYTYAAYVEKVIDGDTVKARLDLGFKVWTRQILRLRGLDCPEAGTAAGEEAKAFVRSHLKESRQITVRGSVSDKYDRYLADIFIPRGEDPGPAADIYLNNLLLETGRAVRMG